MSPFEVRTVKPIITGLRVTVGCDFNPIFWGLVGFVAVIFIVIMEIMEILEIVEACKMVAVVGTIGYSNTEQFDAWVKYYTSHIEKLCFVSGGETSGADALIEQYASVNENNMLVYYPNYNEHGKSAPLIRNQRIVDAADVMIAFWDGKSTGTAHVIGLAKKKGIPIRIINI